MSKAVRTILSLTVAMVMFNTLTMGQAGANDKNSDKSKNDRQHHSRLSKAEFWRHQKDSGKSAKPGQTSKSAPAKATQLKPVSAKASSAKSNMKPQPKESNTSKPSSKKAPEASKAKPGPKAQDRQTASSEQ